jgi:hypothetical protein
MGWGEGCIEDIFANAAEHFVKLIPSQVGYISYEGGHIGTVGSKAARGFFVRGDVFRQRYILVAALILALPI